MSEIQWPIVIPAVLVGTLGWLIYLAGLPMIGIVAGIGAGASLGFAVSGSDMTGMLPLILVCGGGLAGGIAGFWLVRVFQVYLFFVAGSCMGGALALQILQLPALRQFGAPNSLGPLIAAGLAAIGTGLAFVRMRRFIVAVITSVIGVMMLVPGLPVDWRPAGLVVGLVVFLAIQIGLVRRFVDQETFDRRTRAQLRSNRAENKGYYRG